MSTTLDIEVTDLEKFPIFISSRVAKQIEFGVSLGLNKFAQKQVSIERQRAEATFTLRNQWVKKGITFNPSHKNQKPAPIAVIGHRDDYMVRQETGGTKRPTEGGSHVAVPAAIRKSKSKRITKRNRPRALLANTGATRPAFIQTIAPGKVAIVRRKRKRSRFPLEILYFLPTKTRVPKRLDFVESVESNATAGLPFFIDTGIDVALGKLKQFPWVPGT